MSVGPRDAVTVLLVAILASSPLWAARGKPQPDPGEAEELNNRGATLAQEGRYEEAARAFRRAIRLAPDFAVAYFNLGLAESRLGDHEASRKALETAVRIRPDYEGAWLQLGRALLSLNRADEGQQAFQMALGLNPGGAEALYWLGVASWRLRKWASATAHWEALLTRHPDHGSIPKVYEDLPRAYHNLAASIQETLPDEAAKAYREALRLKPGYAAALRGLGGIALTSGRPGDAASAYRELLLYEPDNGLALRGLARSLVLQDSLAGAVLLYRRALAMDARDSKARYGLAEAFLRQGKVAWARGQADSIIAAEPSNPKGHKFRAFVNEHGPNGTRYGNGFRAREAILGYMRALSLEPQDAGAHYNIGVIHGRREFWQKAHDSLLKALEIDSTHTGALQVLPQVKVRLEQ